MLILQDVQAIIESRLSVIYLIRNLLDGKGYVGSAIDIKDRYKAHVRDFNADNNSAYLQNAWKFHGDDNFILEILEIVDDSSKLIEREQYWMDRLQIYKRKNGYNISPTAGSVRGSKRTESQKKNLSNVVKEQWRQKGEFFRERAIEIRGKTFQIISPDGIVHNVKGKRNFCKKNGFARGSLNKLLRGIWKHYKGWRLPGTDIDKVLEDYKFLNPIGELVIIKRRKLRKYCRAIGKSYTAFIEVWSKAKSYNRGWTRFDDEVHRYKVKSPTGKIYSIGFGYISEFARSFNLNASSFQGILSRGRKEYQGWERV